MQAANFRFERATGALTGAHVSERLAALAFATGAKASAPVHWRGFSLGCKAITSFIKQREIVSILNEDARFAFPFGDGYWSLLLDPKFVYEPEIELFLKNIADVDYRFVDGGANFGYWSVLNSSRPFGRHEVIAIEPSSSNAAKLRRNSDLNGGRFSILQKAIGSTDNGHVWLSGAKHEALRIGPEKTSSGTAAEFVGMMSLDSLLDDGMVCPNHKLVVKLDVEGMEIEAIKGSQRLLAQDTAIIVEDHGSDRHHKVSRYLLNEAGCQLFVFDTRANRFKTLTELSALDQIKTSRVFGYNIIATRSVFWKRRIIASTREG